MNPQIDNSFKSGISSMSLLSVVIPVYNEGNTLAQVVDKLATMGVYEIVIVDDCSSDNTADVSAQLERNYRQVRVARHEKNRGKTAALRTGFTLTTGEIV